MTLPDLTAILPTTKSRAAFLPLAFDSARSQLTRLPTTARIEIVVVSEDQEAIGAALQAAYSLRRIDVVTVSHRRGLTLGEKRNLACSHARSPWITFLDDDDWSRSDRFAQTLNATDEKTQLVGTSTMLVHELITAARKTSAYQYVRTDSTYPAWHFVGGTLTFRKALWEKAAFGADKEGAESYWQMRLDPDIEKKTISDDPELYVAFLHGQNTGTRQVTVPQGPSYTPRGGLTYICNVVGEGDVEKGSIRLGQYIAAAAMMGRANSVKGIET